MNLIRNTTIATLLVISQAAFAADTETTPTQNAQLSPYAAGKQAVDAKDWKSAAEHFAKAVQAEPKNADAYNMLGYSQRWLGNYDAAFKAYSQALSLNPQHKGALHYSGIAYLKTNKPEVARANLVKLQAICANCTETAELAKAVAQYQP